MDNLNDILATVSLLFIILAIIYLVFLGFSFLRFKYFYDEKTKNKIGFAFYVSFILLCLIRVLCFILIIVVCSSINQTDDPIESTKTLEINRAFMILLYFPEIMVWMVFFFFFFQLVVLMYQSHIDSITNYASTMKEIENKQKKFFFMGLFVFIIYIIFQICSLILFEKDIFNEVHYILEHSTCSLIIPLFVLLFEVRINRTFSGLPYKSNEIHKLKKKSNKKLLFWTLARTIHGLVDLIVLEIDDIYSYVHINSKSKALKPNEDARYLASIILLTLNKIFTEILPLYLLLSKDFGKSFFKSYFDLQQPLVIQVKEDENSKKHEQTTNFDLDTAFDDLKEGINGSTNLSQKYIYDYGQIDFMDKSKLSEKNRGHQLGLVLEARIKSCEESKNLDSEKLFAVRIVELPNLSPYMLEYITNDINKLIILQTKNAFKYLSKIEGVSFESKKLLLVYEYYKNGSLNNLLFGDRSVNSFLRLSYEVKIKLAYKIALTMSYLQKLTPPLSHSHLTPNNILIDDDFNPRITDLSFTELKKYSALTISYSNKSKYSAPEYLSENSNYISIINEKGDVYSFGLILLEILTEAKIFKDITKKELKRLVVDEDFRPKIPEKVPSYITNMIRCCWQKDPEKRPRFETILMIFKENEKNILN